MKHLIIIILMSVSISSYSQSIMFFNFDKSYQSLNSSKLVKETTRIDITYYPYVGREKIVTRYNDQMKATSILRYNEDDFLGQRLTLMYDNTGTVNIGSILENFEPETGFNYIATRYEFDSKGLISKVIEKDEKNNIVQQIEILYNERGNPTEITVSLENVVLSKQTAEYNYDVNEAIIKYFNNRGELYSTQVEPIDYSIPKPGEIVNNYGEIIKTPTSATEITYDEFGNWTKKVYSRIIDGKTMISSESTNTILYAK